MVLQQLHCQAHLTLTNRKAWHRQSCHPADTSTCRPQRIRRASRRPQHSSHSGCSTTVCAAAEAVQDTESPARLTDTQVGIPNSTAWELDFSSRPVFDERGKKRWELLICSPDGSWRYAQYFPNNRINSGQLKIALSEIMAQPGAVRPSRVRFFRNQMQTIITRALGELEIKAVASRRCFSLLDWLSERIETVYKQDPSYKASSAAAFAMEPSPPEDLPDALRGEQWSFVQLPLSILQEELELVKQKAMFGDTISLQSIGLLDVPADTLIPGVAVYTRRAGPMSAWTAGFELANLTPDTQRACLILEIGVSRRFRYAGYRRSAETEAEAKGWIEAKKAARGLHFLVIQANADTDESAGLWLLLDKELPAV